MEKGFVIRSVSRSIGVLQAINRHGSLSIMGIARYGKLPYPTAFRIVQTLMHEGLIEQEPIRKHYRPTALVQSLAQGYRSETRIIDVAHEHISEFTRRMGWPLFISVRVGTNMVVRDSTHAETSLTFELCHPGFTVPLLSSATGYAMLSTLTDEELDAMVGWVKSERTEAANIDLDVLRTVVGKVRVAGHAAKPCASSTRTSSIAVPITLADGAAEAVLTMTYFTSAMNEKTAVERFAESLKYTARRITESFELERAKLPA